VFAIPRNKNWGKLGKQVGILLAFSTQYIKKINFYSENSPEMDSQSFYKRIQLVFLNPRNAGN
jgi:preprotein translocase subunit SecB